MERGNRCVRLRFPLSQLWLPGAREAVQVYAKLARGRNPNQLAGFARSDLDLLTVVAGPGEFSDIGSAHRRVPDQVHRRCHCRACGPDELLLQFLGPRLVRSVALVEPLERAEISEMRSGREVFPAQFRSILNLSSRSAGGAIDGFEATSFSICVVWHRTGKCRIGGSTPICRNVRAIRI